METNQADLRTLLQQNIAANHEIATHAVKLEEIAAQSPHSIKIIPFVYAGPQDECNCVMYALNIQPEPPCSPLGRYYANTGFVDSLIDSAHLIEITETPQEGSLAIYFVAQKVSHIGKVTKDGRILSKWGAGNLYEHPPMEVPSSYGDVICFFSPIGEDEACECLKEFYG